MNLYIYFNTSSILVETLYNITYIPDLIDIYIYISAALRGLGDGLYIFKPWTWMIYISDL